VMGRRRRRRAQKRNPECPPRRGTDRLSNTYVLAYICGWEGGMLIRSWSMSVY